MSKFDQSFKGRIDLIDFNDDIVFKIKSVVIDFIFYIFYDKENRLGVINLIDIYVVCIGEIFQDICEIYFLLIIVEYKMFFVDIVISEI